MDDRKPERRGLGRGLSALMADISPAPGAEQGAVRRPEAMVPVEKVRPNPDQPRRDFPPEALEDLANSIRTRGIVQPLILREDPTEPGTYQIVAGERRWRAAQMAQLHEVPALIRSYSDTEVLEVAIIENIQRADLNAVEEAAGYRQLMERFGHTQEKLAEALGKSRSHIANSMRLLHLPDEVLTYLRQGQISAGHARALITAEDPVALAGKIVAQGLSVRETEALARKGAAPKARKSGSSSRSEDKDADTRALEQDLSANLGMAVKIDHAPGAEGGRITIAYDSLDALDDLCRILTSSAHRSTM
ncbi:ParB/RepB/Spo0J family partition protein [Solirhodobacter olei]|uniref:ParB/RepB/Spo0J family partition protein n=1 Tax=Solirhodobacter olei TaxID=2493082 RepID=UPI000FD90100|nr:ParB/RepB/Spo0J family partition protein [Solirhodobacter olei]